MASHFESIGLPLDDEQEYMRFLDRISPEASPVALRDPSERYLVWSSGVGATLWINNGPATGSSA